MAPLVNKKCGMYSSVESCDEIVAVRLNGVTWKPSNKPLETRTLVRRAKSGHTPLMDTLSQTRDWPIHIFLILRAKL